MTLMTWLTAKKTMKHTVIFLLVGMVCVLIAAPILRTYATSLSIYGRMGQTTTNNSATNIKEAFYQPFSLMDGQKATIRFSANFPNHSVTLKIVPQGEFEARFAANSSGGSVTGSRFVYCQPRYGSNPPTGCTGDVTSRNIANDDAYIIEFAGWTSTTNLIYVPGNYVVLVYGTNSTNASASTIVRFNIDIAIEMPGRLIARYVDIAGYALLVGFSTVFLFIVLVRSTNEGRS